jgi:hypothetical protein
MTDQVTPKRIVSALDGFELTYFSSADKVLVPFGETERGLAYDLIISSGSGEDLLAIHTRLHLAARLIPFDCLLLVCNSWNEIHRWPTAAVATRADGGHSLRVNASVPFPAGATDAQLSATLGLLLASSNLFAEKAKEIAEMGTWSATDDELTQLSRLESDRIDPAA